MEFSYTSEQQIIAKVASDFSQKEILPGYASRDRARHFPREIWLKMAGVGLLGAMVDPAYGGQGMDGVSLGIIIEELARADVNIAVALIVAELVSYVLEHYSPSEKVKEEWLVPLLQGTKLPALLLTEPHCGTDAADIQTRAVQRGDTYVLTGEKSAGTLVMAADFAVVFARSGPGTRARGIGAFLVPTGLPGIERQSYEDMGAGCLSRGSLFLDGVAVPEEYLVAGPGDGFPAVMKGFDFSRVLLALACIGAASAAIEETKDYVRQRMSFGRPLYLHEGVSFPLAECLSELRAIRWLCYQALWRRDRGFPHSADAAMCKLLAPRHAVRAIHECLLLHGHYGYTKEFLLEQRLRDVIGLEIADGTAQASSMVIARDLFGKSGPNS